MRVRRLLRWLAWGVLAILAMVAVGVVLIETPWGHERVRRILVAQSAKLLAGRLEVQSLTGSLFGGTTLHGVKLVQNDRVVLSAEEIRLRYRLIGFMRGSIDLEEIALLTPVIAIVENQRGWNVTQLLATRADAKPGRPKPMAIHHLSITDGSIHVAPKDGTARDLSGVNFDGALSYVDDRLSLTSTRLRAKDDTTGVVVHQLGGSVVLDRRQIAIDDFEIRTDATHVTGFVRITDRGPRPVLDADVSADPISVPEIARYVPAAKQIPVVAQARVGARGPWDAVHATWTVDTAPADVSGQGTFNLTTGAGTLAAKAFVTDFNLADFTGRRDLTTRLTGTVAVDAKLPASGITNATVNYQIEAPDVAFQTYQASDVQAHGVYSPARLTAVGRGVAYGAPATFDLTWRRREGTIQVNGDARELDLRRLPPGWGAPPVETTLAAHYQFAMDPTGWTADAALEDSIVEGAQLRTGTVAHVESRADRFAYRAEGHVSALDPDRMRRAFTHAAADPRLHGAVETDFRVEGQGPSGAWADHEATASLNMAPSAVGGVHVQHLQLDGALSQRTLTADVAGQFLAEPLVPGHEPPTTSVNGDVDAHVVWRDVSAPITRTSFDGTVKANLGESKAAGLEIDRALLDASVENGTASITQLQVEGPAIKVSATGNVALAEQGQSELAYTVDAYDLKTLGRFVSQEIAGGVHLEGRIGGTQASTTARGTLAAHELKRGSVSILAMEGDYTIEIPDLTWSRARVTSNIGATFVQAGNYKVDRLTATAKYIDETLDLVTRLEQPKRTITGEAAVLLRPESQEVRLRQFAMDAGGTVWQLGSPDAVVKYGREISISRLSLTSGPARLTVEGDLPVKGDAATSSSPDAGITLTAERVPVADIDALLLGSQQLAGQLDGTARLQGSLDAPVADTDLRITAGRAGGVGFQEFRITSDFKGRIAHLNAHLQVDPVTEMTVAGTVPLEGDGLDLRAETNGLQAALLEPMTQSHLTELAGVLTFNVQATGTLKAPSVRGDVKIAGGQFRFVPTNALFTNIVAGVRFDGDRVAIDRFSLEDDDGHALTVAGSSGGSGLARSFEVTARSSGIHLMRNDLGEIALGVDVRGNGSVLAPHIEGTIRVERGRLEVDKLLDRLTKNAYQPTTEEEKTAETPAAQEPPGMFSEASIDVRLRIPDNLVLRGRDIKPSTGTIGLGDLNVTAGGDLQITKDAKSPTTVLGAVQIVRGTYDFQGRRFEIERGSEIRMRGEETFDPALHLTATRDIAGVTARVAVDGTVRRPEITLSSDPPLDQGDVLALIVFNQPVNELGDAEQANLAERAGMLAAGAVATPLADSVAKALDLDVFEIRSADVEGAGPSITVGRQVSERLFVGFRHEFGRDETSRVSFEYRLRSFLRLVTSIGQSSQNPNRIPREEAYGLDLFFVIKR